MSTTEGFAAPATASGIKWEDYKGHLLMFDVKAQEVGMTTAFGNADPIRADIAVLDGPEAGETISDTLVFPRVLISQLKPNVGRKVLGRLGQGAAKPGQSAPWTLSDATDEDKTIARTYVQKNQPPPF
jgi:hypothetical protein